MNYALLAYSREDRSDEPGTRAMHPAIAAVLERPDVTGWVRLHPAESATTVALQARNTLLIDGPFVESKEFLGGLTVVDVPDEEAARMWAGKIAEACGWPQEVRRFKPQFKVE